MLEWRKLQKEAGSNIYYILYPPFSLHNEAAFTLSLLLIWWNWELIRLSRVSVIIIWLEIETTSSSIINKPNQKIRKEYTQLQNSKEVKKAKMFFNVTQNNTNLLQRSKKLPTRKYTHSNKNLAANNPGLPEPHHSKFHRPSKKGDLDK